VKTRAAAPWEDRGVAWWRRSQEPGAARGGVAISDLGGPPGPQTAAYRAFDRFYRGGTYHPGIVFLETLLASWVGMLCGRLLFPSVASLVSIFLVAIYLAPTAKGLLDRNRHQIFVAAVPPRRANLELGLALAVLFFAMFTAWLLAARALALLHLGELAGPELLQQPAGGAAATRIPDLVSLLRHNAGVFAGCFLTALVYRHGGLLLVLGWNAARWGALLSELAASGGALRAGAWSAASVLLRFGPHLIAEALAYVAAAMAGVFLSRALARHRLDSETFARAGRAVLGILIVGLGLLALAAALESALAPAVLESR
jgi:hypothetical protein